MKTESTVMDDPGSPFSSAAAPGDFHLVLMSPDSFSTVALPREGVILVGRSARAQVRLSDPLASGEHLELRVGTELVVLDHASKNGTRLRDDKLVPHQPTALRPGEAVIVGATVLMVQRNRTPLTQRRLWTHAYFESRVEEECEKAEALRQSFAVARLRIDRALPWAAVVPVLAKHLTPPDLFAAYGPFDYEALVSESAGTRADTVLAAVKTNLEARNVQVALGIARFPRDGRSADALIARAGERLGRRPEVVAGSAATLRKPLALEMQRLNQDAARAAAANINILILGETGAGKEVLARTIHRMSRRANQPLVTLNCAGMTETLLESELFGHEKGAFTGATQARAGLLEAANGGTLFLDELGEMPPTFQQRLLRVLEDGKVRRVGANQTRDVDVRIVSATNRDLEVEIRQGRFRLDLFYRLNKLTLTVPPLRERPSEIEGLANLFVQAACEEQGRSPIELSPETIQWLRQYPWPGNVRELKNVMERAVVLCDGDVLGIDDLPPEKRSPVAPTGLPFPAGDSVAMSVRGLSVPPRPPEAADDVGWEQDRARVIGALDANGWNQGRAAAALSITRRTLSNWLDYYRIPRPQKRAESAVDREPTAPTE